ncbi:MAG: hypothetical protein HQK86_05765 [Nitrospinae bacterium]|nr:hypothetical protein [Nitrospinota bacterium]
MKRMKSIATLTVLALIALTAACQDHHFVSYDKMGPLPEPTPSSKEAKPVTTPPATPYKSPMQQSDSKAPPAFTGLIASGVVEVSPESAGSALPGWTLYIIARPVGGGAPIAAKRVDKPAFPVTFELTEKDIMVGQPISGMKLSLEARYDADGDPITKEKSDLFGKMDKEIVVGEKNTKVSLKKQAS